MFVNIMVYDTEMAKKWTISTKQLIILCVEFRTVSHQCSCYNCNH